MFSLIRDRLAALGCEAWELTEQITTRWEFYYIGHRLDQNRSVKTRNFEVKVYQKSDDGAFLGSAVDIIAPTAEPAEIDTALRKLLYQASPVHNPYYTLTSQPVDIPWKTEPVDIPSICRDCIQTLGEIPEEDGARINSYEIFVSSVDRHTLNSNGVEYRCVYPEKELEVVTNASDDLREIELHRIYRSGSCDPEELTGKIVRVMAFGKDRLKAEPTPVNGKLDVLFSTEDAVSIYQYFADRLDASLVYRKMSDWKKGESVFPEITGDRITLEAVSHLPNSSANYPVDAEGNVIEERCLIRDGVVEDYSGNRQFSQYLGLEKSSMLTNLKVSGGTLSEEQLRQGDYLEVVEFSDFQVDPMSGDIAGEIRLGYWHHGGKVTIVTGGSVSGSMNSAAPDMRFSRETIQYDRREIPRATLLRQLTVTGAAK